jgi:TrmH family RNA methyltransferase
MSYRMLSFKEISKLEKRRFRDELGVFVVEGKKMIAEAVQAPVKIEQLLVTDKFYREQSDFIKSLDLNTRFIVTISEHHAEQLTSAQHPAGIFAVIQKPEINFSDITESSLVVALEDIRDPGNLGTMLRTADWFGVESVIVSSDGVDIYNDKVLRSSMGSIFHLNVCMVKDVAQSLTELKQAGFSVIVTRPEAGAASIPATITKKCLVMGNESLGTSPAIDELADFTYAIPRLGKAESLNVAISFGIVLFQFTKE